MSNTDPEAFDPILKARLRAELNRVQPLHSEPRYATTTAPIRAWRLAPVGLAIAFTGIVALTFFATTGSPNPVVWTNRVETVINPPAPSPTPSSSPQSQPQAGPAAPSHKTTSQPTAHAQPTGSPDNESPEPGNDHSGSPESPRPSPSPSSSPSPDQ